MHLEMIWKEPASRHVREVSAFAVGVGLERLCL